MMALLRLRSAFLLLLLAVPFGACSSTGSGGGDDGGDAAVEGGGSSPDGAVSPPEDAGAGIDGAIPGDSGPSDGGIDATDGAATSCTTADWDGPYDLPAEGVCSIDGVCQLSTTPVWANLDRVYATSANDVWMTGNEITVHWDGVSWRGLTGPKLGGAIAGTGPNDVWIGRAHWNGVTLTKSPKPQPGTSTWFASPNDGWSVDGTATAHHWNGVDWTPVATGAAFGLKAVHGFASNDVWAVGGTSVRHWNGAAWVDAPMALPAGEIVNVIGGSSPDDFWVAGPKLFHYVSGAWSEPSPAMTNVRAITSVSTDNVMFVQVGSLARWNGSFMMSFDQGPTTYPCNSTCGGCLSATTIADGTRFIVTGMPSGPLVGSSVSCGPFKRTYAPSETVPMRSPTPILPPVSRVVHWNGTMLSLAGSEIRSGVAAAQKPLWGLTVSDVAVGLSGSAQNDVWVTGYYDSTNIASHWDGATWSPTTLPARPTSSVGAASPTSAWVLTGTTAAYWNGTTWPPKGSHNVSPSRAVWGSGPNDAWVVGNGIAHWDGATWTKVATHAADEVTGTGPNDVVAVRRQNAMIYRWNGTTWSTPPGGSRPGESIMTINALAPNDVWAATQARDARLLHWEGSCWRTVSIPSSNCSYALAVGGSSAELFAVTACQSLRMVR